MKQKNIDWSQEKIYRFQQDFLSWYHEEKRQLPWREFNDPYAIWISEIMLQQTRVETVIGYYYRFMERFPTIHDLANAPEDSLLKTWEGLGYYSRARNLKIAAQQILDEFQGVFPTDVEQIQSLKGIGPYTSGAIASIAFGRPEPAIDGNVMRVTSRLFGIEEDIAKASSRKVFDYYVRSILSVNEPGEMNQAFMDLGSKICTPTSPECAKCPLQEYCYAYKRGESTLYPIKTKKIKPKEVYYLVGAIENSQKEFLLEQREDTGLLAKMWHFPMVEVTKEEYISLKNLWSLSSNKRIDLLEGVAEQDLPILPEISVIWQKRHLGEVTHIFSHLKWHMLLFYGRTTNEINFTNRKWVLPGDYPKYVFPKPQQKLLEQLKKNKKH